MRLIRLFSAVLIAAVALVSLTGCTAGNYEPVKLIPQDTQMIAKIKMGEIIQTISVYAGISSDSAFTEAFDKVKQDFKDQTGVDISTISEIYAFGSSSGSTTDMASDSAAVILKGNFTDTTPAQIVKNTGEDFTSATYGKFSLYTQKSGDSALAKVSDTLLIIGSESGVKDALDVANGDTDPASGDVLTEFNDLGDVLIKLVADIPADASQAFDTQNTPVAMPFDMTPFKDAQMVSFTSALSGLDLQMNTNIKFSSSDSAVSAVDSLNTLMGFFTMMSANETDASGDMLDQMNITSSGATMTVSSVFPLDEMISAISQMQNGNFPLTPNLIPGMDGQNDFIVPSPFGDSDN